MCSIHSISHKSVFRSFFLSSKARINFVTSHRRHRNSVHWILISILSQETHLFSVEKICENLFAVFKTRWFPNKLFINMEIKFDVKIKPLSRERTLIHCWVKTLTVIHPSQQQQLRIYAISIIAYRNFCVEYILSIYSAVRKFLQMFFSFYFYFLFSMSFVFELILICHCCCGRGNFFN